ncbi:sel1 repeat family protein [Comamonas sp. Tr-654]|uniref:sel1 repeat family protein n=1 Tax=Comamonas sp. Tr-654 TaxID=2608341 RepID=UPI00141F2779|nr:sel1 repeat family protein [Comamonas sp. Tr-654]NIF82253.1 sel1 repeat family protein [Comamonas sp. Tr-654]
MWKWIFSFIVIVFLIAGYKAIDKDIDSSSEPKIGESKDSSPTTSHSSIIIPKEGHFNWGMPTKGAKRFSGVRYGSLPIEEADQEPAEILRKAREDGIYAYRAWSLYERCNTLSKTPDTYTLDGSFDITKKCRDYIQKVGNNGDEFLFMAAQSGIPEAKIDYLSMAFYDFDINTATAEQKNKANQAYTMVLDEANNGNADAMVLVAGIYQTGLIVEKNTVASYAYEYAAMKTGLMKNREEVLKILEKDMTRSQINEAIQNGDQIFNICCK